MIDKTIINEGVIGLEKWTSCMTEAIIGIKTSNGNKEKVGHHLTMLDMMIKRMVVDYDIELYSEESANEND